MSQINALVSPRLMTDSSQNTAITYTYKPYGESFATVTDSDASANRYRFTGREYETGYMNFYRSRYYNNRMGRFFSKDTWDGAIINPLSLNKFLYVDGNPINYKDSYGLCSTASVYRARDTEWVQCPHVDHFIDATNYICEHCTYVESVPCFNGIYAVCNYFCSWCYYWNNPWGHTNFFDIRVPCSGNTSSWGNCDNDNLILAKQQALDLLQGSSHCFDNLDNFFQNQIRDTVESLNIGDDLVCGNNNPGNSCGKTNWITGKIHLNDQAFWQLQCDPPGCTLLHEVLHKAFPNIQHSTMKQMFGSTCYSDCPLNSIFGN